jgi:hypothetical protein
MSGLGYGEKQESETEGDRLLCRHCGHQRILIQAWIDGLLTVLAPIQVFELPTKNVELLQAIQSELDGQTAEGDDLSPLCAQCGEAIPVMRLRAKEFQTARPGVDSATGRGSGN